MLLKKSILGLAKLASSEVSCYTLNAIAIEKDCATVTDGVILVNVRNEHPIADENFPAVPGLGHRALTNGDTVLVSRDAALAALKTLPKKEIIPALCNAAMGADGKLYTTDLENVGQFKYEMTGQFPNYRAVIPTKEPIATISFDAKKMIQLCQYFAQYGDGRMPIVKLTVYDSMKPIRLDGKTSDGDAVFALLMPCRE